MTHNNSIFLLINFSRLCTYFIFNCEKSAMSRPLFGVKPFTKLLSKLGVTYVCYQWSNSILLLELSFNMFQILTNIATNVFLNFPSHLQTIMLIKGCEEKTLSVFENGHSKLETTSKIRKREIEAWWLVFLCQNNSTWSNTQNCLKFFAKKKPSRKLLQKQACPLPLSHEKTCNDKEHESSEKMFTLIAFRHYENQISSTCMF